LKNIFAVRFLNAVTDIFSIGSSTLPPGLGDLLNMPHSGRPLCKMHIGAISVLYHHFMPYLEFVERWTIAAV